MSGVSVYRKRLALLQAAVGRQKVDAVLVTDESNVEYLSGFRGHDSFVLVTASGKRYFITDSRYAQEAEETLEGFAVRVVERSTYATVAAIARAAHVKRIGFEGGEVAYNIAAKLRAALRPVRMVSTSGLVEELRAVKDPDEIAAIRDSVRLVKRVIDKVSAAVRPGLSERALAILAETAFIEHGARPAFDPIVASGPHSSKPHAIATDAGIKKNSFVMIDIGCRLDGYCSDITRMVVTGKAKALFSRIYGIVRAAQELAIGSIRPGAKAGDVDKAARGHIAASGFGKYFGHSLGHGVGIEVHERPSISPLGQTELRSGMVFTVEPAIYVPRFGGVRIEDMVLVTDTGCEVLTR